MTAPMPPTAHTDSYTVVIEGLQKATLDNDTQLDTLSMTLHGDEPLSGLWKRIEECGFTKPLTLENGSLVYAENFPMFAVSEHDEVRVVADYQASTPTTIRFSDTLISHANAHHVQPLDFGITALQDSQHAVQDSHGFQVSIERTIRMPDDNKLHQIPGSLGHCDLYSVQAYADRLPNRIRNAGGVFFAMWQREAMWLNFQAGSRRSAVRAFMGHVNVITGKEMSQELTAQKEGTLQDYFVVPGQAWLDGICVAPGVVRQFVAMPLGSGYTVEGQKTSAEKHGGLQLEVTPELVAKQRLWSYAKDACVFLSDVTSYHDLDELSTPHELGCNIGDVLRSYSTEKAYRHPVRIQDLAKVEAGVMCDTGRFQDTHTLSMGTVLLLAPPGSRWHPPLISYGRSSSYDPPPQRANCLQYASLPPTRGTKKLGGVVAKDMKDNVTEGDKQTSVEHIEVQVEAIKAMGLAAGGKLVQDIYKDPYPATIWNHAAARILHVHILDPESCEKVTHIVPKPPPIDVREYTKTGGQFYVVEERVDDRLDGGDFHNVKSVRQMDQHIGITTEPEFDPTKPKMCTTCEIRLCDCIVRPCDHQFCNVCIRRIDSSDDAESESQEKHWKCPTCDSAVSHVAGFSAPMNLPGEEPLRTKVPVNVLKIEDGRMRFSSVQRSRV